MIALAIFFRVALSMPSNPGVELTSKTKGPLSDSNRSTPQTGSFNAFAAFNAAFFCIQLNVTCTSSSM